MRSWLSECCAFFWCHTKSSRRHKNDSVVANQGSAVAVKTSSSNPVIRANDVIDFVVPSVAQRSRSIQHQHQQQLQLADNHFYYQLEMSTLNNVRMNRSSSFLNAADLNLKLYSPGQETNDDIHTGKSKIGVSFQYDPQRRELLVKILGALSLPGRTKRIPPNPYVKVTILPKKLIKYTTKTLRANNNPLFNEIFVFDVSTLDLDESQLYLKVRDRYDLPRYVNCESSVFRSTITLGHAIISFVDLQLTAGRNPVRCHRKVIWCLLQPKLKDKITSVENSKGEINVCLFYEPESKRMILEVIQIRNVPLRNQDKDKMSVKILLYEKGYLKATRRTQAVKCEASASFKEKFDFTMQTRSIHESSCQVILVTKTKIGTKRTLGYITLGYRHCFSMNYTSMSHTGLDHWHDMEHRPRTLIGRWHALI